MAYCLSGHYQAITWNKIDFLLVGFCNIQSYFIVSAQTTVLCNQFETDIFNIAATSPRDNGLRYSCCIELK